MHLFESCCIFPLTHYAVLLPQESTWLELNNTTQLLLSSKRRQTNNVNCESIDIQYVKENDQ